MPKKEERNKRRKAQESRSESFVIASYALAHRSPLTKVERCAPHLEVLAGSQSSGSQIGRADLTSVNCRIVHSAFESAGVGL